MKNKFDPITQPFSYMQSKLDEAKSKVSPQEIDRTVCNWSMDEGVSLTEHQLNTLVDLLSELFGCSQ